MTDTTATTTRVADELAIRNLLARLVWLADHCPIDELDDYVACFTDDAEWSMFGETRVGHDAIRAGAEERRTTAMMGPGTHVAHFLACTLVEFDDSDADRADARSYIQAYRDIAESPTLFLMGRYHDSFHRTPDGWKLARRVVDFS